MIISNSEMQIPRQIFIKVYFKTFPLLRVRGAGSGGGGKKIKEVSSEFSCKRAAGFRWTWQAEHNDRSRKACERLD